MYMCHSVHVYVCLCVCAYMRKPVTESSSLWHILSELVDLWNSLEMGYLSYVYDITVTNQTQTTIWFMLETPNEIDASIWHVLVSCARPGLARETRHVCVQEGHIWCLCVLKEVNMYMFSVDTATFSRRNHPCSSNLTTTVSDYVNTFV